MDKEIVGELFEIYKVLFSSENPQQNCSFDIIVYIQLVLFLILLIKNKNRYEKNMLLKNRPNAVTKCLKQIQLYTEKKITCPYEPSQIPVLKHATLCNRKISLV